MGGSHGLVAHTDDTDCKDHNVQANITYSHNFELLATGI